MANETIPKDSEQIGESKDDTVWASLTNSAKSETWEEHLEKANKLTAADERALLDYSDRGRYDKKKFFQDMAQQEKLEREFNSRLSHVEDLELLANVKDSGVERTNTKYEGQDITVYVLKDYPFEFLGHIINYREGDTVSKIGTNTSDELVNNPKKWFEPYQAPKDNETVGGWSKDRENSRSNTLSTSYVDGTLQGYDEGLAQGNGQHGKSIIYAFDHIRPTTLIYAKNRDGQVPNYVKQGDGYRNRGIKDLVPDTSTLGGKFNEVAMFRYDDSGSPLEPSAIITDQPDVLLDTESSPEEISVTGQNGEQYAQRTNAFYKNRIKKHALEHGVPIILIDRKSYGSNREGDVPFDEYIAKNWQSILAAGTNPDFVKSKLSAETVWNNYDNLKAYLPNLDVNTEFNNLINSRYTQEIAKYGDGSSADDQKRAYADAVYNTIVGNDAYDFLDKGGDRTELLEIANKTGDADVINYTQQLLKTWPY